MGIETYLAVGFWAGVIRIVLGLFVIGTAKYPRKSEYSLGFDVVWLIIAIAFFVWVCFLKFGGVK